MRYFELRDDVRVPNRWHLGEVLTQDGGEPRLRAGLPFVDTIRPMQLDIARVGMPLEYSMTSFAVPISRSALADAIVRVADGDVQRIAVDITAHPGFEALNSVRVVRCLDEVRSEFLKWTDKDHRGDLAGQYRMVTSLRILSDRIPRDAHFFRIEGWLIALIVSEEVKLAMEMVGCLGAKFVEVT